MSAWDRMIVAKNYPGKIKTPFVAGMNLMRMPSICCSVGGSIESANTLGQSNQQDLGSSDVTVIMWCPSATAFFGTGGEGQIPSTTKLGGMVVK